MIFAATDWLSISINLLLVVFVIICLLMTVMILMQRPKQEGLGAAFGGGMTDQMFGARTTNVLQRGTVWFASLFFLLALTLAVLIGIKNGRNESLLSDADSTEVGANTTAAEEQAAESVVETIRDLVEEPATAVESTVEEPTAAEEPANVEESAPAEESTETSESADATAPAETTAPEETAEQP